MPASWLDIRRSFADVLEGNPWYGKAVYPILETVDPAKAYDKAVRGNHTPVELLYHMLTWSEFTLAQVENASPRELEALEALDWRTINPSIHSWHKGLAALKEVNRKILVWMDNADESELDRKAALRTYTYRALVEGLIQHLIYHSAQVVILVKSEQS